MTKPGFRNDHGGRRESDRSSVRAIVEQMADGIVIVGLDGVIRFSNPAAQQLFGRSEAQLEGMHLGFARGRGRHR